MSSTDEVVDAVPHVALWGDDVSVLGTVEVAPLDAATAVALSRGKLPKPYAHLDPNEDAVLAAGSQGATLLAVADGHSGFDAARAAIAGVSDRLAVLDVSVVTEPEAVVGALLVAARERVRRALADAAAPRHESRTTLALALVTPGWVHAATWGDSMVMRVRRRRARAVGSASEFLGPTAQPPRVVSQRLREGEFVVVCSDGVLDYVEDWPKRVPQVLTSSAGAEQAAHGLVEAAWAGGAGDHVAVALTQHDPGA